MIRKFVSTTVSPGGVGKSSLTIAEALSLVTGRNLIGNEPHGTYRVWLWNGEDPEDELQRRIVATAMHYGITEADIGGRLFVNSGRDTEIVIARQERNGTVVAVPVVEAIRATILGNMIDVVVIDPVRQLPCGQRERQRRHQCRCDRLGADRRQHRDGR